MKIRKILALVLGLFGILFVSSCFDLGAFEDTKDYYNTFQTVTLIPQKITDSRRYDFSYYFYNETTGGDFDFDYCVDEDKYIYFALCVEQNFTMTDFSLWMYSSEIKTNEDGTTSVGGIMHYSMFVMDTIPKKIRGYDDAKTEKVPKKDENGNEMKDENGNIIYEDQDIEYDDPVDNIAAGMVNVSSEWNSFTASFDELKMVEGQYIIIRFDNNSGLGKDLGYESIKFTLTNVLIRATSVGND